MKSMFELPSNYKPLLSVDLAKNKKLFIGINAAALVIGVLLAVLGALSHPITAFFDLELMGATLLRLLVVILSLVAYVVLHELVHGLFIRIFSGRRATYKFTLAYASAGSEAYFGKWPYIVIALSPVVLLGAVLFLLCLVLPEAWFWVAYVVQIMNLSGAAGDYFVTLRFCALPRDILVRDSGTAMTVYAPENT